MMLYVLVGLGIDILFLFFCFVEDGNDCSAAEEAFKRFAAIDIAPDESQVVTLQRTDLVDM
ncbi:MAG: hypothetical protein P8N76_17870 [Pirellulaceae bacterium]|nr:hypothetical protein [Pirellulaceae bacterium]